MSRTKKSLLAAALCATAATGAGAGPAFAGEATGNFGRTGKTTPVANYVAASICSFSGQNPERFLTGDAYEPGRTQSYGQIPKSERNALPAFERPGSACNGHTGFLAGGGSASG